MKNRFENRLLNSAFSYSQFLKKYQKLMADNNYQRESVCEFLVELKLFKKEFEELNTLQNFYDFTDDLKLINALILKFDNL